MAHTTDVDGMLSQMSHEQFNEWCAKDLIEPIGTPQGLADVLAKIGMIIAAFAGQDVKESYFMPWVKDHQESQQPLTRKQSAAALTAHLQMLSGGAR